MAAVERRGGRRAERDASQADECAIGRPQYRPRGAPQPPRSAAAASVRATLLSGTWWHLMVCSLRVRVFSLVKRSQLKVEKNEAVAALETEEERIVNNMQKQARPLTKLGCCAVCHAWLKPARVWCCARS
jgi:hypothetical protein